jgi:6-phosphogluconolactonase
MVWVGSAGCDGDDHGCKEGRLEEEQWIRPLMVLPNGSMFVMGNSRLPILSVPAGGQPAWLTGTGEASKGCLFATLPGDSKVFSYGPAGAQTVASGGVNPVFAAPTADGGVLLVANYHGPDNANSSDGAAVTSFKIGSNCSLTLVDTLPHSGQSVNPQRQGGAHPHSFVPVRDNLAYACDLGMDVIFTYSVSPEGKLKELYRFPVAHGSGPRHLVQHPELDVLYVVSEMAQTVSAYAQTMGGTLLLKSTVLLSKDGKPGVGSKSAEIAISPDGRFVYATNRGSENTVTVLQVQKDGSLFRQSQVEAPAFPRGMMLLPGGKILLVAGQSKTEVWSYSVGKDGNLAKAAVLVSASADPSDPAAPLPLPPHPATFTSVRAIPGLATVV